MRPTIEGDTPHALFGSWNDSRVTGTVDDVKEDIDIRHP